MLGGSHRVQRNRDSDVVGVGIAAGHGTHCRLRDGAPEEQETQQAIEKPPHRRCGKQGKRGVDTEGCTDIASGHNGEEQRGISDVESGTGEGTLDIRGQHLEPGRKISHCDDRSDDEDAGDNAAHPAPFMKLESARPPPVAGGNAAAVR